MSTPVVGPTFHPDTPTFHPDNKTASPNPSSLAAQTKTASTGYGKEISANEKMGATPQEATVVPEMEQQAAGENEYWDNLWKTNPTEVWKTNPRKALAYSVHGFAKNALNKDNSNLLTPEQRQDLSKYKHPKIVNTIANLVMPNPSETALKAGTPPIPGAGILEGVEPSQVLMGVEEAVPENMRNVTPENTPENTPSHALAKLPGARPAIKVNAEGPQWERTISAKWNGEDAGRVGYKVNPQGVAQVYGAVVPAAIRGRGVGTEIYRNMIDDARANGATKITSDSTNITEPAARTWKKLQREGYPIQEITHPNGKPGFSLDLTEQTARPIGHSTIETLPDGTQIKTGSHENIETIRAGEKALVNSDKIAEDAIPQFRHAMMSKWEEAGRPGLFEDFYADKLRSYTAVTTTQPLENPAVKTIKTASGREMAVPPERTTGNADIDNAIKTGGGIPAGVMKKAGNMPHDLVLFHDHHTGSTLALPENEVSPENVASHIAESRAKFSAGENKLSSIPGAIALKTENPTEHPIVSAIKEKYGSSTTPSDMVQNGASFLHADGTVSHLGTTEHPMAVAQAQGLGAEAAKDVDRPQLINDTGSIRVRYRPTDRAGPEIVFSVPNHGVSETQASAMRAAVGDMQKKAGGNGNLLIEVANPDNEVSESARSWPENEVKEFARPSDVDQMLRKLRVHPEQEIRPWMDVAANENKQSGGFTVNPTNGNIPTQGKIVSIAPELEVNLGHPATADDIRDYYLAHKAMFDSHPELHIGGYGNELNISAIGPHAEEVAKKLDRESVYDLGKKESIPTGGANVVKSFPKYPIYPIDERLADLTGELPIPERYRDFFKNQGYTWANARGHEIGHAIFGDLNGFPAKETSSHLHPNSGQALLTQRLDLSKIGTPVIKNGSIVAYDANPDLLRQNVNGLLEAFYGGGMVQQELDGIPFSQNPGVVGDKKLINDILRMSGLGIQERMDVENAVKARIKDVLTNTKIQDIIRKYREVREAGLDKTLQISEAQNQRMMKEVREALDASNKGTVGTNDNPAGGTTPVGNSQGNVAGAKGGTESGIIEKPAIQKSIKGSAAKKVVNNKRSTINALDFIKALRKSTIQPR